MKVLCYLGIHAYGEVTHRPCERFQTCSRCGKEQVFPGWHRFGDWSETYYVNVHYSIGGFGSNHEYQEEESRQTRYCTDCKIKDTKTLI